MNQSEKYTHMHIKYTELRKKYKKIQQTLNETEEKRHYFWSQYDYYQHLYMALNNVIKSNFYKIKFKIKINDENIEEKEKVIFCAHPVIAVKIIKNEYFNLEFGDSYILERHTLDSNRFQLISIEKLG